uniref:Mitochondrial import inner membrane translocase subunit tim23 n=1 Tax=Rhizophora mucronata TaxID=61149 RepID=A0A2P2K4A5_RHIMU
MLWIGMFRSWYGL